LAALATIVAAVFDDSGVRYCIHSHKQVFCVSLGLMFMNTSPQNN
jgi:hypothetical protein